MYWLRFEKNGLVGSA